MIENKNRTEAENSSLEVAEDSREADWKSKSFLGSVYMGDLDMNLAFPFPAQPEQDKAEGDAVIARFETWADEHLDGEEIDRTGEIPASVFRGLALQGLFAIKIPKEYGGLGLSQTNYMRLLSAIAARCGATAATLSAHQSIGVPQPLKLFGTDAQKKKYLPKFAEGWVSAFALTEPNAGSDPANMTTTAELSEDGQSWILNGEKLWCTNGVIADVIVVMARTPDVTVKGRTKKQITAFIVETDWAGVDVLHRCEFMGIRAIENGILRFTDVAVPVENVVGDVGGGLKLALTTLNDGRLGIPAISARAGTEIAEFSARWAKSRSQWGKAVGAHEPGSTKLADVTAGAYAMAALSDYCAALSDAGDIDLRMEAAAAKMFNTEVMWDLADTALQLRGGRGYETAASLQARGDTAFPLERALRDARINRIVEGTTDIMRLFLAREALDTHLKLAMGLFQKGGDKVGTLLKCAAFYPGWYAKLWLGGLFKSYAGFDSDLRGHLQWVDARTRKLARTLFHKMALLGPKLEMRQNTLARVVDIGAELAVMALVISRVQTEKKAGNTANVAIALHWLQSRRIAVDRLFGDIKHNTDASATAVARALMEQAELLPEADTSHLQPMPREYGRHLTSGAATTRTRGTGNAELDAASEPHTDDRAAK